MATEERFFFFAVNHHSKLKILAEGQQILWGGGTPVSFNIVFSFVWMFVVEDTKYSHLNIKFFRSFKFSIILQTISLREQVGWEQKHW